MLYAVVQWLHVVAAITALGANVTYFFWLTRAAGDTATLPFTLGTIRVLENYLANPSYGVAGVTGLVLSSIVLYPAVGALGGRLYGPNLRRQIALAREGGGESGDYQALHGRGNRIGALIVVLVLIIIYLMMAQPLLWG